MTKVINKKRLCFATAFCVAAFLAGCGDKASSENAKKVEAHETLPLFSLADSADHMEVLPVGIGDAVRPSTIDGRLYRNFVQLLRTTGGVESLNDSVETSCPTGLQITLLKDSLEIGKFRLADIVIRLGYDKGFWIPKKIGKINKFLNDVGIKYKPCESRDSLKENDESESQVVENFVQKNMQKGQVDFVRDGMPNAVSDFVSARIPSLKHAYNKFIAKSAFEGLISLNVTVDGDKPTVAVASSTTNAPAFDEKIQSMVSSWKIPVEKGTAFLLQLKFVQSLVGESLNKEHETQMKKISEDVNQTLKDLDDLIFVADTALGTPLYEIAKTSNRLTVTFSKKKCEKSNSVTLETEDFQKFVKLLQNTRIETFAGQCLCVSHADLVLFRDSVNVMELHAVGEGFSYLEKFGNETREFAGGAWKSSKEDEIDQFFKKIEAGLGDCSEITP